MIQYTVSLTPFDRSSVSLHILWSRSASTEPIFTPFVYQFQVDNSKV